MIRTIGKGFLWLVKGIGIAGFWILKAALEAAKLTLLLFGMVLRIVLAFVGGCTQM